MDVIQEIFKRKTYPLYFPRSQKFMWISVSILWYMLWLSKWTGFVVCQKFVKLGQIYYKIGHIHFKSQLRTRSFKIGYWNYSFAKFQRPISWKFYWLKKKVFFHQVFILYRKIFIMRTMAEDCAYTDFW